MASADDLGSPPPLVYPGRSPPRGRSAAPLPLHGAIASLGRAAELSRRLVAPVRLTAVFEPHRKSPWVMIERIHGDPRAASPEGPTRPERVAEILAGPEMLPADAFAALIGVTRETVRLKRRRHEILGLEGAKRGVRFPTWQVTEDGGLLPGLPRVFKLLGDNSWTVYRFLLEPRGAFDRQNAVEALKTGKIDQVVAVAASLAGAC